MTQKGIRKLIPQQMSQVIQTLIQHKIQTQHQQQTQQVIQIQIQNQIQHKTLLIEKLQVIHLITDYAYQAMTGRVSLNMQTTTQKQWTNQQGIQQQTPTQQIKVILIPTQLIKRHQTVKQIQVKTQYQTV